jgi:hypothetical protein
MARFVSGEIVVIPFPFTDFSSTKVRPALVLASLSRGDIILCQITARQPDIPKPSPCWPPISTRVVPLSDPVSRCLIE